MGSKPDPMQTQAAQSNLALSQQAAANAAKQNAREDDQYASIKPFLTNRLQNGLPYFNQLQDAQSGLVARAYAPAYQNLNQQYSQYVNLPSGAAASARTALDSDRARAFDSQLLNGLQLNDAARQDAAAGIAGQQGLALNAAMGNQNSALNGNAGVMNATTLTHQGMGGVLGGIVGSLGSAALGNVKGGIPF